MIKKDVFMLVFQFCWLFGGRGKGKGKNFLAFVFGFIVESLGLVNYMKWFIVYLC